MLFPPQVGGGEPTAAAVLAVGFNWYRTRRANKQKLRQFGFLWRVTAGALYRPEGRLSVAMAMRSSSASFLNAAWIAPAGP
jgi:hypothetical protein